MSHSCLLYTSSDSETLPPQGSGYIVLMLQVPTGWKELQVTYMPTFAPDKTLDVYKRQEKTLTMHRMQTMQGKTRLSRRCAKSVQKCAEPQKKENPTRNLTILRGILVRSRELESLAL